MFFINCPFDVNYRPLLKSLTFSLVHLGFEPNLSETTSSGQIRIDEIKKKIRSSLFSIHDISRNQSLSAGEFARFNLPYELGLDIGCQSFGNGNLKQKKCLILDSTRHRYQRFISDISGQDIKDHNNEPQRLVYRVREWLATALNIHLTSATVIWENYLEFVNDLSRQLKTEGFSKDEIADLPIGNFILLSRQWIREKLSIK